MERQQEQQFTLDEITSALNGLDVDARQTVLNALHQQSETRQLEKSEQEFTGSITRFAAVYERATAESADDSNIEGWYEDLHMESEHLLGLFANRDSLTDVETLVRDTAALNYLYLSLEHDSNAWDADLLVNAGANLDDLLKKFRDGVVAAHVAAGREADEVSATVNERYRTLDDFSYNLYSDYWTQIVQPTGIAMRAKLIESGYALPKLNEEGMYGEDDEIDTAQTS